MRTLHRVLIYTRFQAYENVDTKTIGDVMDVAEYLVAILQNPEGLTEEQTLKTFRLHLADIETRFPGYTGLTAAFDTGWQTQIAHSLSDNNSVVAREAH